MKMRESELRLQNFAEMNLSSEVMLSLAEMNVIEPTLVQSEALPVAMARTDLIAIAQTGSGKTLAFALPILAHFQKDPASRALILVPSREMAMQIFGVFESLCAKAPIKACLVIGGVPDNKQNSQLKKKPQLIVATPGRMNDLLRDNKLLLQGVATIVIDEADRMLDLGFAPQLKDIQKTLRGVWQTMLFSATFGRDVETIAEIFMREDVVMVRAGDVNAPTSSLEQTVFFLPDGKKNDLMIEELKTTPGGAIVFADSQESAELVSQHLKQNGQSVDLIHGDLSQGHRSRVVRDFRGGKFRVLVTTDLLARGLDVAGVEQVINFDLPYKPEDFLHRIGRTARAGRPGKAITFITPGDRVKYEKIKPYLKGAREVTLPGAEIKRPRDFKKTYKKRSKK